MNDWKSGPDILVYLPAAVEFEEVAKAVRDEGGTVVWCGRDGAQSSQGDLVRVGLAEEVPDTVSGVILGAEHELNRQELKRRVEALVRAGRVVWVEVVDAERGAECEAWGATGLVACGFEGGGFVGEESGLVLLRRLYRETGLPIVVRGGVGPDGAAAVVAAGAAGVVLEEQLWSLPEYPTAPAFRERLESFNPTDTRCLGMSLGFRYRVFALIATRPPRELAKREVELKEVGASGGDFYAEILQRVPRKSWDFDLRGELRPLGQGAGLAGYFREHFGDTRGALRGIREHVASVMDGLSQDFPLEAGKGIARANATRLPIHQGPMAQVSDTPAFAKAVSDAGALPWLALGNMPTEVAEDVVSRTGQALKGAPYGAGIIGLDANRYRDGHMEMMKARRAKEPILGLVAAGTAEQAMQFESAGLSSYLHTPTPGVLKAALSSGHRKVLLEGAEAGGHVGTLGALALWQYAVVELERAIREGVAPQELAVVAAGGIGDAAGAAAAAGLFYGLYRRGVNFGVQIGSAYLMTKEAVETGAVSPTYQEVAARSRGTVVMGESVNTPTRVLKNQAADKVLQSEQDRLVAGERLSERKHLYERDNLGGLRAAAKAQRIARVDPEKGAIFEGLTKAEQLAEGLFHCGQAVTLCRRGFSIEELHQEVTQGARRWVVDEAYRSSFRGKGTQDKGTFRTAATQPGEATRMTTRKTDVVDGEQAIAIIGVGARMPGAMSAESFWQNIVNGVSSIASVPSDRWDPALYFDSDPTAPDKTYSQIGGWITDFEFNRRAFRLPPKVVESIDPTQLLCLEATREALEDAGYLDADFDRDRCAVILGNALGGDLRDTTNLRILYPEVDRSLRKTLMELSDLRLSAGEREALLQAVEERFKRDLVGINEDSMPGELANIIAGRVAQTFNLRGPNYVTDAACASSLAALEAAVRGLRAGQFDMAVTGGADRTMGAPSFVKFSKIGALSADGSRPFDAGANGFVMGEGAGILVLKRLSDAIRDGDQVYALIRGVGGSSDGRGKAITAPNPEGQKLAVRRAYQDAGFGPRTVSLIEAHGTSTSVGDPAEVRSLLEVFDEDGSELSAGHIALGSVKSNIGHLKSAAGAAGLIKAAFALKYGVLPPTLNVEQPNPKLNLEGSGVAIQRQADEWRVKEGAVRRAGVSAFGFGGTNFHVAMEEYLPGESARGQFFGGSVKALKTSVKTEGILGFGGENIDEVREKFDAFMRAFEQEGVEGVEPFRVSLEGGELPEAGPVRLAIAFCDAEELSKKAEKAQRALNGKMSWRVLANQGVVFREAPTQGKTAMLFPGQGTQYLGMLSDLTQRFSVVAETFAEADRIMAPIINGRLSEIIDPDLNQVDEVEAFQALTQTEITQPAVLTADIAIYRLLKALGIKPDMVAGHSLGEYGACVAAGVMSFEEALKTVAARGTEMSRATPMNGDKGLMAGISASVEVVQPVLDEVEGYVVCANINCPGQTIIAGLTDSVKAAAQRFEQMGYDVPLLPVSHAFHTEVVAAASEPLRRHLGGVDVQTPQVPILTNVTGDFYPSGVEEIRDLLARQVASPVQFIGLVERMYEAGARRFIEVGPKRAQTSFVGSILEGRDHLALYTNHPKKGGVATLFEALATLWASGVWGESTSQGEMDRSAEEPAIAMDSVDRGMSGAREKGAPGPSRDEILEVMLGVLCEKTGYDPEEIELDFELEADLGVDTVKQAEIMAAVREEFSLERDEEFRLAEYPTLGRMADYVEERLGGAEADRERTQASVVEAETTLIDADQDPRAPREGEMAEGVGPQAPARDEILEVMLGVLCEKTGYDPAEIELDFELEADLGVDTVKQAEIMAAVREEFSLERDEEFRLAEYPTLGRMADYVEERVAKPSGNASEGPVEELIEEQVKEQVEEQVEELASAAVHVEADVVISGCAVGLPGQDELFSEKTVERLLEGTNFIGSLSEELKRSIVAKHIVRLQKHKDGGGEMVPVTRTDEVIKLAGQAGSFDLQQWGVPQRLIEALDRTSQLAFAAGFEALRDAGLPLIPRYRETRSGKKVTIGWTLPEEVGDKTGVIFASAFAGQDALIEELKASQEDENYQFNHRFLVRVLGIANARFAEYVGARGPNTKINNACASTTTAIGMAQDWIRAGRCERVIILSADDASGEALMEWVGSGFLATGAATTKEHVEDAALPFDKRRHGMIIGMGALSLVVEAGGLPEARGIEPIADVLATHFVNSAYHPTRLDVDHIAGEVHTLMSRAEERFEIKREEIAEKTVFISHETYTPARGGSAAAEIAALRTAFGDQANRVVIANTKGYTGHAMGAGIEDVLAMKVLQHEKVPAIANFKEADPDLGDLRLSQGGDYEADYALRLAAGFGSQLALALFRHRARGEDRVIDASAYARWLGEVSGFEAPELAVEKRVLRLRDGRPDDRPPRGGEPVEEVSGEEAPAAAGNFPFRLVAVEAHTAAVADALTLKERLAGKNVVVLSGPMMFTDLMRRTAERCGARVLVLADREERGPLDGDCADCDLLDEEAIRRVLERFGEVDGVINLLGFGKPEATSREVYLAARRTFHVARVFQAMTGGTPTAEQFFVTVTGQGGRLGFDQLNTPFPICGAVGGFTKSLFREWEQANVRVVDVAREGIYPELGLQILGECFSGSHAAEARSPEVGIIGGMRHLPVFVEVDDVIRGGQKDFAPGSDSVVVLTGGAKGITAEVAVDLAERFGCKLALVGRSQLSHPDPLGVDMQAEKERVKRELKARGERVTPVRVRDELWSLKSQRQIQQNMQRMRRAGSEVEYFSCDVADGTSVQKLFDEVRRRFGKVTGVIHGAGVEESKFLADKDVRGFDRVFRGKALGGLHLWQEARLDSPAFFVAFASVAGRFGNAGQCDYSAANEVLARLTARINATTKTRALTIDWTAWDEVGMAVDGSMRTILESRGVEFLPPEVGAPMVGDAIEMGLIGEALVAGELGELAEGVTMPPRKVESEFSTGRFALVDRVVERGAQVVVVERVFDPQQDHFINDHVYEGTPILPGVMGFELMANAAQMLTGKPVSEMRNVEFDRAIKLHRGKPVRVIATAKIVSEGPEGVEVEALLESLRTGKTGRALRKEHFRASMTCGGRRRAPAESFVVDGRADLRRGPKRPEIYRRFFHTGRFQVLDEVPLVGDDLVIGYGRLCGGRLVSPGRSGVFATDPMVREMALQTVGLWGMVHKQRSYLPLGIGRSVQFAQARPNQEVCIRARRRDDAREHAIAFDVEVRDREGELLHWLEKVELIGHRSLLEEENFSELPPLNYRVERLSEAEARMVLADRSTDESTLFTAEERAGYERLKSARRRGEWLAARVAARLVASRYFRDFYGEALALDEVSVTRADTGAPSLLFAREHRGRSLPHLTITHCAGVALAAVTLPGRRERIGVDLETIEVRTEGFAGDYFTDSERRLSLMNGSGVVAPQVLHTGLWTVKEAVAKALGLGLKLATQEIVVEGFSKLAEGHHVVDVRLEGRALQAAEAMGASAQIKAELHVVGGFAMTTARLSVGEKKRVFDDEALAAVAALLEHRGLLRKKSVTKADAVQRRAVNPWRIR